MAFWRKTKCKTSKRSSPTNHCVLLNGKKTARICSILMEPNRKQHQSCFDTHVHTYAQQKVHFQQGTSLGFPTFPNR